jgi:glycosyltransferase involved in cell wall biosynthesis
MPAAPQRRICLISPGHAASNPRLIKDADALHAAGYAVHVIASWYFPPLDVFDREIYSAAPWERTVVYALTGPRVIFSKLLQRFARSRAAAGYRLSVAMAARAQHHTSRLLRAAAKNVPADLYIGHCLAALPAAAGAARHRRARYGFDVEDFHSQETEAAIRNPALARSIHTLESALLPGCAHLTASSPLIAEAVAKTYSVRRPETLLNVFPRSQAPAGPHTDPPLQRPARLYWFSQTIGPDRGLEPLLNVLALLRTPCDLHLRGLPTAGFVEHLRARAQQVGFKGELRFLPTASAAEMPRLAASADLGLSLEQSTPLNRDLCLTNKIFTYLLAGVPVGLTPTTAQRALARELGDAALLLDLSNPELTAANLDAFLQNPERRTAASDAAWRLGQTRFNWDLEQQTLLRSVDAAFTSPT